MKTKFCPKCRKNKALRFFDNRRCSKDGKQSACQKCRLEERRVWRDKNRDRIRKQGRDWNKRHAGKRKIARRAYHIKIRYGITADDFNKLAARHNGNCHICRRPPKPCTNLHIDHCHTTGIVRGLLCGRCNKALGLLRDDLAILRNAAAYLRKAAANS